MFPFNDIAKCDRCVFVKVLFLYVCRKVLALLPFACGCPVWLNPKISSQGMHLQLLSNTPTPFIVNLHVVRVVLLSDCGSS